MTHEPWRSMLQETLEPMIDLYYWPTPNGWKISIALEEMGLPYEVHWVDLSAGDQFDPEFLRISPNNRMPAIVDHEPADGGEPISVFESGAILLYLADKTGLFLPRDPRGRSEVVQWLMWQMGGLGPMLGQHGHFRLYAPRILEAEGDDRDVSYALERYRQEAERLYGVLDGRLENREHLAGDYSVADMACWPWVLTYKSQGIDLASYPHVRRWYDALKERPGLRRGYALGREKRAGRDSREGPDEQTRRNLFGRGKRSTG